MKIYSKVYTDKGSRALINQDSVLSIIGDRLSVFCIADGMGGHQHGEIASAKITTQIGVWYKEIVTLTGKLQFSDILASFEKTVSGVNRYIFEKYNQNGICGSTLAALIIFEDKYAVFSAGDSRVYLKRKLRFSQLTSDDVWQNTYPSLRKYTYDSEQLALDPNYGKLTKAIGVYESIILNRTTGMVIKKDCFFLCCDGVHKCIPNDRLERIIKRTNKIKELVIKAGAPDNYSFVSVRIL